jgi:hypothetical protein
MLSGLAVARRPSRQFAVGLDVLSKDIGAVVEIQELWRQRSFVKGAGPK